MTKSDNQKDGKKTTLPETNIARINEWLVHMKFPFGMTYFRELVV